MLANTLTSNGKGGMTWTEPIDQLVVGIEINQALWDPNELPGEASMANPRATPNNPGSSGNMKILSNFANSRSDTAWVSIINPSSGAQLKEQLARAVGANDQGDLEEFDDVLVYWCGSGEWEKDGQLVLHTQGARDSSEFIHGPQDLVDYLFQPLIDAGCQSISLVLDLGFALPSSRDTLARALSGTVNTEFHNNITILTSVRGGTQRKISARFNETTCTPFMAGVVAPCLELGANTDLRWINKDLALGSSEWIHEGINMSWDNGCFEPINQGRDVHPILFDGLMKSAIEGFSGRDWLFQLLERWLPTDKAKVLLLKGEKGLGKTSFVAKACHQLNDEQVAAYHFFQSSSIDTLGEAGLVRNILSRIQRTAEEPVDENGDVWRDVKEAVSTGTQLTEAVRKYMSRLRSSLDNIQRAVIFLDGLDELILSPQGRATMAVVRALVDESPDWIKFVFTTKSDVPEVEEVLARVDCVPVSLNVDRNAHDVDDWIAERFEASKEELSKVVEASRGNFLTASLLMGFFSQEQLKTEKLPHGLNGIYKAIADAKWTDELGDNVLLVLNMLAAADGPVPASVLEVGTELTSQDLEDVFIALCGLVDRRIDGMVRFKHSSFKDWAIKNGWTSSPKRNCRVSLKAGHRALWKGAKGAWKESRSLWAAVHGIQHGKKSNAKDLTAIVGHASWATLILEQGSSMAQLHHNVDLAGGATSVAKAMIANESTTRELHTVANAFLVREKTKAAMMLTVRALEILRAEGDLGKEYCSLLLTLGNARLLVGDYVLSCEAFEAALTALSKDGQDKSRLFAGALSNYAMACKLKGELEQAENIYTEVLRMYSDLSGRENEEYASNLHNQGLVRFARGNYPGAIEAYREALNIKALLFGASTLTSAKTLNSLGLAYKASGQYKKAIEKLQEASRVYKSSNRPNLVARAWINLGNVHILMEDYDDAVSRLMKALTVMNVTDGKTLTYARALHSLATAYRGRDEYEKALALHQEAMDLISSLVGPKTLPWTVAGMASAETDFSRGKPKQAREKLKSVTKASKKLADVGTAQLYAMNLFNLAIVYEHLRDWEKAMESIGKYMELVKTPSKEDKVVFERLRGRATNPATASVRSINVASNNPSLSSRGNSRSNTNASLKSSGDSQHFEPRGSSASAGRALLANPPPNLPDLSKQLPTSTA